MPRLSIAIIALAITVAIAPSMLGATIAEQRRELARAATALRTAERMYRAGRGEDAVAAFTAAQDALVRVAKGLDKRLEPTLERGIEQLALAHAALEKADLKPPPLADISRSPDSTLGTAPAEPPSRGRVSFVQHVVPILTTKCGSCHVDGSRGGMSMASYRAMMDSNIIEIGSGFESRLINIIAAGQMPPESANSVVSPAETQVLLRWINQGAKFDGDDPATDLAKLAATATSRPAAASSEGATTNARPVAMATGKESVSFALDIAPMLVESCGECHGTGGPRAGFSVATFEQLWAGGDSGHAIRPGKPEESLLLQKLLGTAAEGVRMPQGRPPWSDNRVQLVKKWIAEGATFDGPSTTESTARVAALVRAERSTPEQLAQHREQSAARQWQLAIPDETGSQAASERFLVIGNLPESALGRLASQAESEADRVLRFFKAAGDPLNKSRITIFAFEKRIDYSEFGTMVERRELPRQLRGHSKYDLVTPYIALVANADEPERTSRILATHIGALWAADQAQGRLPEWFAEGAGMAAAAELWPRDKEVQRWKSQLPAAIRSLSETDAFMTGKLPPTTTSLLAYGFVDALMQKRGNFSRIVQAAAAGDDFAAACQQVFQRSPKELADLWVGSQRTRP